MQNWCKYNSMSLSLRSSERGLKYCISETASVSYLSLRSSERGLKLQVRKNKIGILCRSVRRSVD